MQIKGNYLRLLLLPCLLFLCCTVPHLEQGDFRRDTVRYAAVGHYMWAHGPLGVSYLDPQTPYFNKPPLATAIHGLALQTLGVNLAAARLPSILAALGTVIFSVLTLRLLASKTEAIVSGLVLATTYEFFRRTREISLDFWQLCFVMLAVFLTVRALKNRSVIGLLAAGAPLGLALLCKPLVALGTLPVLALWAVLMGQRRAAIWILTGTLAVALIVAAPWHLYMWSLFGNAFLRQYFGHEVVSRARGEMSTNPFYFYLVIMAQSYWPWTLAAVWAVWVRWFRPKGSQRHAHRDVTLLAAAWVGCLLIFLSCFPDKKVNYALPLYPMLSWMAAAGLCRLPWRKLRTWRARQFAYLAPATVALFVLLSVLPIQFQAPPSKDRLALFNWMREAKIPPASVRYFNLEPETISYFYLKTGAFPVRIAPATNADLTSPILIKRDPKTALPAPALFVAGNLAVISGTKLLAFLPQVK